MEDEKAHGSSSIGQYDEALSKIAAARIIPRHEPQPKFWVVNGTVIKSFTRQADAEAEAIIAARNYPGQTIRVTKTIKAFRTKEPAVETLESE